jgi:hypothetical protein
MRYVPHGQLRLTADELAIACTVLTAPGHELLHRADARAALAGLRDAGALDEDGMLTEPAASIVSAIARAELRVEVRVWRRDDDLAEHRVWAGDGHVAVGDLTPAGFELTLVEPQRLPLALALRLGLAEDEPAIDSAREAVELAPDAAALADDVRVAWTATSSWRESSGGWHTGAVSALDRGASGWWAFAPGPMTVLEPSDAQSLWVRLHALLSGPLEPGENIGEMADDDRARRA